MPNCIWSKPSYPLTAIHGYSLDTRKALQVSARYANSSSAALKRMVGMASGRDETLPYGALVLNAIVRQAQPSDVIFSAFGVREGIMYRLLGEADREKDPLITACQDIAQLRARSKIHAKELIGWTDALFESPGPIETFEERRLRHAACLLSDMAWRGHPDYRGEQSAVLVAQSAIVGVDHPGRAFLALCVYHRYERRLYGRAFAEAFRADSAAGAQARTHRGPGCTPRSHAFCGDGRSFAANQD